MTEHGFRLHGLHRKTAVLPILDESVRSIASKKADIPITIKHSQQFPTTTHTCVA
jgi:hypothetical protein